MSTEETEVKKSEQALARPGDNALAMGFQSGESFALLQRVATVLSQSTLVPKEFQGHLPNCIIALNMAARLHADPLMVMQNLYVVYGRPAWSAQFLIATLNQSGGFSKLRYEWQGTKGEPNWGCRAWATDSTGEKLCGTWITWELAKAEGWVDKNGSKWKTMPEQMFTYRAGAWFVKAYAPEISMGLPTRDEIEDLDMIEVEPGSYEIRPAAAEEPPAPGEVNDEKATTLASKLKQRRAASKTEQPPQPEPEPESKPEPAPAPTPAPAPAPAPEATENPDDADDKVAEQREELGAMYERVVKQHGEKVAKDRLEMAAGFRTPARVKEEKLGIAIDAMQATLELPEQK